MRPPGVVPLLLMSLAGCASATELAAASPQERDPGPDHTAPPAAQPADRPPPSGDKTPAGRGPVLIYTATLTMAVFQVERGLKDVEELARELGGFLAHRSNDAITVRVPAGRFHETLARLEKLGDITHRQLDAQDITQEYLDLEVRLRSARAVRERLEQLLARAARVDDSIAIERELERVTGEIERLQGRLKYLRDRADYSTITVTFAPRAQELVAKDTFKLPFPWLDQLGLGRLLQLR
jgi:hypothetical protein